MKLQISIWSTKVLFNIRIVS